MRKRATKALGFVATAAVVLAITPRAEANPLATCRGEKVTIVATAGNDVITGTPEQDIVNGGDGNDTISGLGGDDILCGGAGDDTLIAGDGADEAIGDAGNDYLGLGAGNDKGTGGSYSWTDSVVTDDGDDTIDGGPGQDIDLIGDNATFGLHKVAGGKGGTDKITDPDGANFVVGGHLSWFSSATGYDGGDTINIGGVANTTVVGDHWGSEAPVSVSGPANDTINTGGGNDMVIADTWNQGTGFGTGGGNDYINTGAGEDTLYGNEAVDVCNGGPGTDKAPGKSCETVVAVP